MNREHNDVLQIRLPKELKERFKEAVISDGGKVSDKIRGYIETYVRIKEKLSHDEIEQIRRIF